MIIYRNKSAEMNVRHFSPGFTLVEMMVAVALVLLMMSLFAEIFSLATGSMLRQKGVAENDQRARMVITLLKGDLEKRTFRDVVPFEPGTTTTIPYIGSKLPNRQGYLSYSENNPDDETDDTFRLTIDVAQRSLNKDTSPLYGKATVIGGGIGVDPNQPETDDGQFGVADGTGMSQWAEVVYFLRGGRLYRRQMLIRNPYISGALADPTTGNPPTSTATLTATYNYGSNVFWRDFDYSAFYDYTAGRVRFHDVNSLDNRDSGTVINVGGSITIPASLGIPHLRFGHSPFVASGIPKEFTSSLDSGTFIGCLTHEETSHTSCTHPGTTSAVGSHPFSRPDLTVNAATSAVTQYEGDPNARTGEDMLLANVLSFDIKIWDPAASIGNDGVPGDFRNRQIFYQGVASNGDDDGNGTINDNIERGWENSDDGTFVDLGHSDPHGLYTRIPGNPNANPSTSATFPSYGNRFDTWHPAATWDGTNAAPLPPYRAMHYLPAGSSLAIPGYQNYRLPNGGVNGGVWQPTTQYTVGTVIFPTTAVSQGHSFAYRCIVNTVAAPNNLSGASEPTWSTEPGGTTLDNNVQWQTVENLIPVKALQFRVRYLDISSGLVRDLTLVHYLTE